MDSATKGAAASVWILEATAQLYDEQTRAAASLTLVALLQGTLRYIDTALLQVLIRDAHNEVLRRPPAPELVPFTRGSVAYPFPPHSHKEWDIECANARMTMHERGDESHWRACLAAELLGAELQALRDAGNVRFDLAQVAQKVQVVAGQTFSDSELAGAVFLLGKHWIHGTQIELVDATGVDQVVS